MRTRTAPSNDVDEVTDVRGIGDPGRVMISVVIGLPDFVQIDKLFLIDFHRNVSSFRASTKECQYSGYIPFLTNSRTGVSRQVKLVRDTDLPSTL